MPKALPATKQVKTMTQKQIADKNLKKKTRNLLLGPTCSSLVQ